MSAPPDYLTPALPAHLMRTRIATLPATPENLQGYGFLVKARLSPIGAVIFSTVATPPSMGTTCWVMPYHLNRRAAITGAPSRHASVSAASTTIEAYRGIFR